MFEEEFEKLTRGDQNQFRKVLSDLLYRCYIVRRSFDRASGMNKISADYLFIERHFDLISDYLSFAGMELSKDDDNGVVFLTSSDETNRIRIDGVTTLILFALRSYYEDKLKDNPAINEIYIDSTGLKVLLKDMGLTTVSRRISAVSLADSLRTLVMYNIISLAKGSLGEANYAFYILPSIRYVISNAKLNALYNAVKAINDEGSQTSSAFGQEPDRQEDEDDESEDGEAKIADPFAKKAEEETAVEDPFAKKDEAAPEQEGAAEEGEEK
jgi:uncharacterized protein YneF (UPF0154 family)